MIKLSCCWPLPSPVSGLCWSRFSASALFSALCCAGLSMVTPSTQADSDEQALVALMALLEQETRLATKTRMNADYVPGTAIVLYGQDARQSGKHTVADVLSDVAGMFLVPTNSGDLRTIVRGIGATQNVSNMKFLLDDVAVNRATDGSADWLLRMPLSQVDRIEIIRGPGSALHGGFAFSGVVNVISRRDSSVGLLAGSRDTRQADVAAHHQWADGKTASLNYSSWSQDNSGASTELDSFPRRFSHSPGTLYDHEQGQLIRVGLGNDQYSLSLLHVATERGPGFGRSGALPAELKPRDESFWGLNLESMWSLSSTLDVSGALIWQQTELIEADFVPIPAGVGRPDNQSPRTEDVFVRLGNRDSRTHASLGVHWQPHPAHTLFVGLEYAYLRVHDALQTSTRPGRAAVNGPPGSAQVLPGSDRYIASVTVQEQWAVNPALDLTLGLRHDSYSDHVDHSSPRVALLWRPADHHIIKLQYAEAFRPPTLMEANPGGHSRIRRSRELDEEVIRSAELAYIYRASGKRLRVTVFDTFVSDQIEFYLNPGDAPVWRNRSDIESRGVELEWRQGFARDWSWDFNLTWIKAQDFLDDDKQLLGAASLVANSSLSWRPSPTWRHTLSMHGASEREGHEGRSGDGERFDAYVLLDYALHWQGVAGIRDLDMTLACLNLADAEYHSPASPNHFPTGLVQGRRMYQAGLSLGF